MPHDTPAPLAAAAARRHELTRSRAIQAIRELDRAGTPVTFAAVATAAGISRAWLYTQPDIRSHIQRLRQETQNAPAPAIPASQRASDSSLRARLTTALDRNHALTQENARLRRQLARALGDQRTSQPQFSNDQGPLNSRPSPAALSPQTLSTTISRRSQPRSGRELKIRLGVTGGLGIIVLLTLTSVAVVAYFARHQNYETLWRRLTAPALSAALLAGIAALALQHYALLLGVPPGDPAAWALPATFYGLPAVTGLAWALRLRARYPQVYATIGLGPHAVTGTLAPLPEDTGR